VSRQTRSDRKPLRADPATSTDARLPGLILDHVRDGIILLDINGRVKWMNPACEQMLGWPLSELKGCNPQEKILPPESRPPREETENFRYDFSTSLFDRYRITQHLRRDGSRFWNQQSHSLIDLGPDDTQKMVVVTCRDVSEQVTTQAALQQVKDDLDHAAYHDDLTGLGNRKKMSRYMRSRKVMAQIMAGRIGVLQLDLDKFKEVNDTLATRPAMRCCTMWPTVCANRSGPAIWSAAPAAMSFF